MNAKYKVTFYVDFKEEKDEGIAFGKDYGDIVNNICHYYGEDAIEEVTITLFEDYDQQVLPRTTIVDYLDDSEDYIIKPQA